MVEWGPMRKCIETMLPEALKVLEWEQTQEAVSFTSAGEKYTYNRGSEQGETLGPAKAVSPVALARKKAMNTPFVDDATTARTSSSTAFMEGEWGNAAERCLEPTREGTLGTRALDLWFMDDNRMFIQPQAADRVIQALDREMRKLGVIRATGADIKSTVRIVCPEDEVSNWSGDQQPWLTDYIKNTCQILPPNPPTEYLGTLTSGEVDATKSANLFL